MNDAVDIFRQEAAEHLDTLEEALLELEEHPEDPEQINLAFRAMHTIKGAAGMVGFDHLSSFTHHLESFFDRARNGDFTLKPAMISLILECRDHIQQLLDDPSPDEVLQQMSQELEKRLQQFSPSSTPTKKTASVQPEKDLQSDSSRCWRIQMIPNALAFQDGMDCLPLLRELDGLGEMDVFTRVREVSPEQFDPLSSYLEILVLIRTSVPQETLEDVFIFVSDDWDVTIDELHVTEEARFGDIVVEKGWITASEIERLLQNRPRVGEVLQSAGILKPNQVESVLAEQQFMHKQAKKKAPEEQIVKVPSGKLDMLMNLIGELVIVQARLNELARVEHCEQLNTLAEELSLLGSELRDTAFDIRMLPIGSTFARFRRLVRDLGKELDKEVQLETEGAETELDKMVLDKLGDPLVHLLRNSMDHGIEHPAERMAAGKPVKGTILLSAAHHDGQILITIKDDGAGLNADKIQKKARQKGLISASQELEPAQIYQLIFEPGFSTAEKVSDVSGRGVGMDVVRTSIEMLQGRVDIDSQPGQGTTITIYLPMTLAIIEGLMVRVSREHYIIPLSVVEECIETSSKEQTTSDGARLVENRGQLTPCVRLRELFDVDGHQPDIEQTVITHAGKERLGITVDEVVGQYQTVIKSLSRLYQHIPGLMGATILGNGDVAMILDINKLVAEAKPLRESMPIMSR
ncbi:chemotaxis protein CheA [Celerinatantimonas sp. YJH-8]|uniref:chemotaxis protein CheA n=1 Tax=Celerinatantimonas sp. YJH-8 TaxID=3228714 RepID=UPI0038C939B8